MNMFRIAGQTSGPFELKFFVDTHGGCYNLKIFENYFIKFFFKFFFQVLGLFFIVLERVFR